MESPGKSLSVSIESNFDIQFIAALALREKQIQQIYRPIIAVHKWFARRPGTLFRALALSEFGDGTLPDLFFQGNDFSGRKVADPFMGGGTPLVEANRVGCDVIGADINPMSAWIVREEIEQLDLDHYQDEAARLLLELRLEMEDFYLTDCPLYGDIDVPVKYFLWVKVLICEYCGQSFDLFPSYVLSANSRHPANVLVCSECGDLNEVTDLDVPGSCVACEAQLLVEGPARRNRCVCRHCGRENLYPRAQDGAPKHRLFGIEYFNPLRKQGHKGRFFKSPDEKDLARIDALGGRWSQTESRFVPGQEIPAGDETDRLLRWGYTFYREMFNDRQLLGLELSCRLIHQVTDSRVRNALATNLSDLLRYQNMLCRYDSRALKSLDIFSIHGFPVGLIQCESNLLGFVNGQGKNVGSGGWTNIIGKFTKAKRYCAEPFEVQRRGSKNVQVPTEGESIGEGLYNGHTRQVTIRCGDAAEFDLEPRTLDAVFTDPPYFGNVQYGELMDFCYVWLRGLVGEEHEGFDRLTTRDPQELTGNATQSRGLEHFTNGLSRTYSRMAHALKPGGPLAFTYHHNNLEAYCAVGVAVLDAGLICTASLPCPAEMGGSIHIHGTGSSVIDTVFVCRDQGEGPPEWLFDSFEQLLAVVSGDIAQIAKGGRSPTKGDIRCIIFGHLTRMAIYNLQGNWAAGVGIQEKLSRFEQALNQLPDPGELANRLHKQSLVGESLDQSA